MLCPVRKHCRVIVCCETYAGRWWDIWLYPIRDLTACCCSIQIKLGHNDTVDNKHLGCDFEFSEVIEDDNDGWWGVRDFLVWISGWLVWALYIWCCIADVIVNLDEGSIKTNGFVDRCTLRKPHTPAFNLYAVNHLSPVEYISEGIVVYVWFNIIIPIMNGFCVWYIL